MKKTLFSLLLLGFSLNANAWQQVSPSTPGVTINRNSQERSKSFQVQFKNDSAAKASLAPAISGLGYKVALNRCKNVAAGANCSVTVSFDGTKIAGAASPGQTAPGSLSGVTLESFVVKTSPAEIKSATVSPQAPALTFTAGQRSQLLAFTVSNTGNVAMIPQVSATGASIAVNRCKASLAAQKSCMVYLSVPNQAGSPSLTVASSGMASPALASVSVTPSGGVVTPPGPTPYPFAYRPSWQAPPTPTLAACELPRTLSYDWVCKDVATNQEVGFSFCDRYNLDPAGAMGLSQWADLVESIMGAEPTPETFTSTEECNELPVTLIYEDLYGIDQFRKGYILRVDFGTPVTLSPDYESYIETANSYVESVYYNSSNHQLYVYLRPYGDDIAIGAPITAKIKAGYAVTTDAKPNKASNVISFVSHKLTVSSIPTDSKLDGGIDGAYDTFSSTNIQYAFFYLYEHQELRLDWSAYSGGSLTQATLSLSPNYIQPSYIDSDFPSEYPYIRINGLQLSADAVLSIHAQ